MTAGGRRGAGRFAPSPSGDLHLGNLRTALLAWLFARSTGRLFLMRMEDLDRVAPGAAERQLRDLRELGLEWDGEIVRQSERVCRYRAAIEQLDRAGLIYECFCTRREIREASSAPHGPAAEGRYPGSPGIRSATCCTCRQLTPNQRAERRVTRPPALRLRAQVDSLIFVDQLSGICAGLVEDVVLQRNDGLPAYNLAVVVDDAAQGVDQVVRGIDLLPATPSQVHLGQLLDLPTPSYAHVPLALNTAGQRLAKRDGAVTLAELAQRGWSSADVLAVLATSLGLRPGTPTTMLDGFDPASLPRTPWVVDPALLTRAEAGGVESR